MNKIKLLLSIICLTSLLSCNRADFSNPEDVIKNFRTLSIENKNDILYDDFLSAKSKEFVTKDEFIKNSNIPDSISNFTKYLETNISTYPVDVNNPSYRRFKVEEKSIVKSDTIYSRLYYTVLNENGKWKILWTNTLQSFAKEKYNAGNYSEARHTLEKIIEINPFNGSAYREMAWSYLRDQSLSRNEWENGIVKNAKYAVTLEEDNQAHYNTLAAYYSETRNSDLAIENWERGLNYCQNKKEKIKFYLNIAGEYIVNRKFEKAEEFIKKSLKIDAKRASVWFKYGTLMQAQDKKNEAIEYFEKALKEEKMENSLQGNLYSSYAFCCLEKGNCDVAKEYVNKALDIEPNNDIYQALFKQIKNCNADFNNSLNDNNKEVQDFKIPEDILKTGITNPEMLQVIKTKKDSENFTFKEKKSDNRWYIITNKSTMEQFRYHTYYESIYGYVCFSSKPLREIKKFFKENFCCDLVGCVSEDEDNFNCHGKDEETGGCYNVSASKEGNKYKIEYHWECD